jgi:hypothetical protein
MGLLDSIKGMFGKAQSKLPQDMNSTAEVKDAAQDLAQQHGDQVNKVVDAAQDKLPGTTGDGVVDAAQKKLDEFADKPTQQQPAAASTSQPTPAVQPAPPTPPTTQPQ